MTRVVDAHCGCDFSNREEARLKVVPRLLQTDQREVAERRNSYLSLEYMRQPPGGKLHGFRHFCQIQMALIVVLDQNLHNLHPAVTVRTAYPGGTACRIR